LVSSSTRPAAPAGTWRIGRFGGVDLLIRPSLLLMGAVLIAVFARRFEGRSDSNPYVLSAAFVLALYVSVLVHELAHVAVARRFRLRVQSVTLHLLGGETLIEGESRTPWQELATSIAGPIASLVIGLVGLEIESNTTGTFSDIVYSIAYVNILVAIFNMLPGLPLDGGRVFRAVIWQITGNEATGVRIAAWIGRFAAVGVLVFALIYRGSGSNDEATVNLLVAILVAWFLWQGASDALSHANRTSRIDKLVARDIGFPGATPPPNAEHLSVDLRGGDLLRAMAARPAEAYALTEADGSLFGVLTSRAVDEAYRASRR
jgi:Zn-dependent protease